MGALIQAEGLSKRFGKVQALSDLTLTLPRVSPWPFSGRTEPARRRSSA